MTRRTGQYDVMLDDVGFMVVEGTYYETGRTPLLEKNIMEMADTGLDFSIGWPYAQRSWLLGEQQEFSHEWDELKTTAPRRYYEGHGVNNEKHGKLSLLRALSRSLTPATCGGNFSTCPMCTNKTGSTVYAFPAGQTNMWKYAAGAWTSEAITGVTAPVTDCVNAGDELYIVDSNASGSRVLKRSSAGVWSRITVDSQSDTFGYDEVGSDTYTMALNAKMVTMFTVEYAATISKLSAYVDGQGTGTGDQVMKGVIYSFSANKPSALLGTTVEVTVIDGQAAGWVDLTFSSPVSLAAGAYCLGLHAGANTNTIRFYRLATSSAESFYNTTDTYADGPASTFGATTDSTNQYCIYATFTYVPAGWATTAYDTATAVAWSNGELYILSSTALYCHTIGEYGSEWVGGTMMCSHSGGIFFSDGSNRVYLYQGLGTRLILEDLPDGFQVQSLFSKQSRLWVCGQLANGDAAIYWYSRQMWGICALLERGSSTSRSIKAGTASTEHVIFADSKYGGTTRHYISEGGISHYYATGTECTVPYKGLTFGATHICEALYKNDSAFDGIYIDSSTAYVASGTVIGSNIDLQMPGHTKKWHSITVECLPLAAGEKIDVYFSVDNGVTYTYYGEISGVNNTSEEFRLDVEGVVGQYKLVIYAGTSALTTPSVVSITMRGSPIVNYGMKWEMVLKGHLDVEDHTGRSDSGMKDKVNTLLQKINTATLMKFVDMYGDEHQVVARPYKKQVFRESVENPRVIGSQVAVVLEEAP